MNQTNDVVNKKISGKNNIRYIISIPRSNSTLLELILGLSSSVSGVIHEPFHRFGYYNEPEEKSFDKLSESISNNLKKGKGEKCLIMKDMAHWIVKNDVFKKLIFEEKNPVILLIKEPLITIESKIKKILFSVGNKNRHELNNILRKKLSEKKLDYQTNFLLDLFAIKNKYNSWKEMVAEYVQKREYVIFEPIIKYYIISSKEDIWGWESIDIVRNYFEKNNISYIILNGSDLQNEPEKVLKLICKKINIKFDKNMLKPSTKKFKEMLNINFNQPDGLLWYDKTLSSTEIQKPDNHAVSIDCFPVFIRRYIEKIALPIYNKLMIDKNKVF